jgi:two-component system CitB family sensor kinase/two-component system sensor histidine kinase DcuS
MFVKVVKSSQMKLLAAIKKLGLHNKLAFLSSSLIVLQVAGLGFFTVHYLQQNLEEQIGNNALSIAQTLTHSNEIRQGLIQQDSDSIQKYVENIRQQINARFIVVGDTQGIRYSHPDPKNIGKKMVGGDNDRALQLGHSYTSKAIGSLGTSLRGKSPILSGQGNIIGLISVGYLESDIDIVVDKLKYTFYYVFGVVLLSGALLTLYIAKRYRDEMFGLEPEEIARTYSEHKAVLASILEGIVVIDEFGIVTSINSGALKILGDIDPKKIIGSSISELLPEYTFLFSEKSQQSWRDVEVEANNQTLIMTKTPLIIADAQRGVVVTFQLKDDIVVLSQKLSQVQQFSTMLRVQTHEYSNKLNTIGGLIQIGSIDEALDLITNESSGYQKLIAFLIRTIPDPVLAGLFLGKYDVAKERSIEFIIDTDSSLSEVPNHIPREKLVTVLGNLIDNAFDASIANQQRSPKVLLSMTDIGPDLIFEIEDSGNGINDQLIKNIFTLGETTKADMGHGIGMYLVSSCLKQIGGSLSITKAKSGCMIMTVYIPKMNSKHLSGDDTK